MNEFFSVALGGALGSLARWGVCTGMRSLSGVLIVNIVGSLLAGVLFGQRWIELSKIKALLLTGFLGGFTTFSAFSLETLEFALTRGLGTALLNIMLQVTGSLLAVWLGYRLVS